MSFCWEQQDLCSVSPLCRGIKHVGNVSGESGYKNRHCRPSISWEVPRATKWTGAVQRSEYRKYSEILTLLSTNLIRGIAFSLPCSLM